MPRYTWLSVSEQADGTDTELWVYDARHGDYILMAMSTDVAERVTALLNAHASDAP